MSLNIREAQILLHYSLDATGLIWHHRVLLVRIEGARWVVLTPDSDLVVIDLAVPRHTILDRNAAFPHAAAQVYAFDPISRAELDGHKRRARIQANVLAGVLDAEIDEKIWIIAEMGHVRFSQQLTDQEVADSVTNVTKGSTVVDGIEVFIEEMEATKVPSWRLGKLASESDLRLLGNHRSTDGRRRLQLALAVDLMKETPIDDWPLPGERVLKEFCQSVASGPGNFTSYNTEWKMRAGISEYSSVAHDHRILCDVLRLAHDVDQIDGSNLACLEQIARRLVQHETAVERNPRNPDYTGLDLIMGEPVSASGAARTQRFTGWLNERMKEQSNI
jgi:hypothetical protein